jgi:hypothetical protein
MMTRAKFVGTCVCWLAGLMVLGTIAWPRPWLARAQEPYQFETDLVARRRVFRDVGAGFRSIRRGPRGNYFILTAPAPAVRIYDVTGKPVAQIPNEIELKNKGAALVYGQAFDVSPDGHVVVCDRGANTLKIYTPDGALYGVIPFTVPVSVAWLVNDEIAVTSPNASHLVTVFSSDGNLIRDFGDREEISDRADLNNQVNFGELVSDAEGTSYFAFDYLPEPTVRAFDRAGYMTLEISLNTLEFQPAAQAARRAFARLDAQPPALHHIVSAIGVDPVSHEVWMSIGTQLMRYDKEGNRLATFRTYLPNNARLEPATILVEPDRLLMGADPLGIYEFRKPTPLPK